MGRFSFSGVLLHPDHVSGFLELCVHLEAGGPGDPSVPLWFPPGPFRPHSGRGA